MGHRRHTRPINPLTAGTAFTRILHLLLACTISAFKHIEDKM